MSMLTANMWRTRRRASGFVRAPKVSRQFEPRDFWILKHDKGQGQEVVITLLCGQGQGAMHKMTFCDRGPIKLHNHNLKAEVMLRELDPENISLPRCVRILAAWRKRGQVNGDFESLRSRLDPIISWAAHVGQMRAVLKNTEDSDGLDMPQYKRQLALLYDWHQKLIEKLKDKHEPKWRQEYYSRKQTGEDASYITRAKLNASKLHIRIGRNTLPQVLRVPDYWDKHKQVHEEPKLVERVSAAESHNVVRVKVHEG